MKPSTRWIKVFSFGCLLSAACAFADPTVLRWNGASGALWDATAANWLDTGNNAVAWQAGATAQFSGNGGLVNIAANLTVGDLTFTGNGYTLAGCGLLTVTGGVSAAAATTNSVAVDIRAASGLAKNGTGTLALLHTSGLLSVSEGTVLIGARDCADADISLTSGAALAVLGGPATNANLVANASFEYPALSAGAYAYASATAISNWTSASFVCRENTAAGNAWNSAGTSPDGNHVLILQYNGTVTQTVTVPSDGIYALSFYHFLRQNYPETTLRAYIGGVRIACFMNQAVQFAHQLYISAPLYLKAGSYELKLEGDGGQGDRASMVDAVCLAAPSSASAANTLGGLSTLRAATGASVSLPFAGTLPLARVYIDGVLQSAGSFSAAHASGIFSGSGTLSSTAPGNIYAWSTASGGVWSSGANWESASAPTASGSQNFSLLFPLGASTALGFTNDLSGTFSLNQLRATGSSDSAAARFAGNTLLFTNSAAGTQPRFAVAGAGNATVLAPVSVCTNLTVDTVGAVTFSGTVAFPSTNAYYFSKSGPGSVLLSSVNNAPSCYQVYEGSLTLNGSQTNARLISLAGPFMNVAAGVVVNSYTNRTAAFYLAQAGSPLTAATYLSGLGESALGTRCGGATVTYDAYAYSFGSYSVFDVGPGDTLRILQLIENVNDASIKSYSTLVKAGAGTLEIRTPGVNNSTRRAYTGATVLRNGTLRLSVDDCGQLTDTTNPFNGQSYTGLGGSLGYSAFSTPVRIGDYATESTNTLALVANGNGRWIGHDIEVFNKGAAVTLGATTGSVMFADTITLHRDIGFSGPADGYLFVSNIVAAADFSGTGALTLSGFAGLRVEGGLPAGASLAVGARSLRFGTRSVRAQTLAALGLGGTVGAPAVLDVDFGSGANDTVTVTTPGGLVLSNTLVNLYYASNGQPFAEPGSYTLFSYAGTLGGDAALLSITNLPAGTSYAISNDVANGRVLLSIGIAAGGTSYTWKSTNGGDWSTGANWDIGSAPNAAGTVPLFGVAATTNATIALGGSYTVGGLAFNNSAYGYTLSGGSLTLDNGGPQPVITVGAGTHTLATTLNGSTGVAVAAPGATLVLGSNATVNTALALASGTLRVAASNAAVGTFTAGSAAALEFADSASKLTVNQSANGAAAVALKGNAGTLLKQGASTLALTGSGAAFSGTVSVAAGTLALQGLTTPGTLSIAAAGAVSVLAPATNGLTGYFYNVTPNTNNFFTLAAMEAHFATLKPDLVSANGSYTTNLDFGATGALFPAPYGIGGTRTIYFESVWRGALSIASADYYTFRVSGDDGFLLAIDGQQVLCRPYYSAAATEGVIYLEAGAHDFVLGHFQFTSTSGLQVQVRSLNTAFVGLPNAWLAPYASVGSLAGSGGLSLAVSNAVFAAAQNTSSSFSGDLSGPAGSLFVKNGAGSLTLNPASATSNAFAGDVSVQSGFLTLAANERLGDASLLAVANGAQFKLAAVETLGGLSGAGNVTLGGNLYVSTFNGDADSDISASKTYTHTLDFPDGSSNAVVNGVTFYASAMNGSRNGYGWGVTAGSAPTGVMNQSPYDYAYTGVTALLWDFYYGSVDYTLTLTGLTPGKSYETRLYFRNWQSNSRYLDFTFTAGATALGTIFHNPDSVTRSYVGCRYTADIAGTLSIRIYSERSSDTCHLYGLSNEEVATNTATALTLNTPAGKTFRHTGALSGSGALAKLGPGTQIFSGTNSVAAPFDVQAGTLAFEPGASVLSGVVVRAGATVAAPYGNVALGGLSGAGTFSLQGLAPYPTNRLYFVTFTNDAGTEISSAKVYTHLLDFGTRSSPATVINGVTFNKTSSTNGSLNGYGWINFPPSTHGGSAPPVVSSSSGIYNLLYDMNYGWCYPGSATVQLVGLTVGKRYEVRLYNRSWGSGNDRTQTLTFDPDGAGPVSDAVTFNPDALSPNLLAYRYTAGTTNLAITISSKLSNQTYHLYGLSNEEVYDATNVPVTVGIASASVLSGPITGGGAWIKTGAASLTVSGVSTATGAVAVTAGAFGAANSGTATLGPVSVAAGAMLVGDGRVGGDVAVASNATLRAGTSSACGALQIGGNLAIAQGANILWRFAASAADTIAVGGCLTFPTNGTVTASALTAGALAPARSVLFSSAQTINGPANLAGWTVAGINKASLSYSADRTQIYLKTPRGTLLLLQ